MRSLLPKLVVIFPLTTFVVPTSQAQSFHDRLMAMPEGTWATVNVNRFDSVWRLDDQAPTPAGKDLAGRPKAIIQAWSSMAWDSRRGDIIVWGGGHANYAGNEIYRWRSSSLRWERASLPSQVVKVNASFGIYETVDGIFNAPIAAHTYDNQEYLANVDRFISFGGAAYNSGHYWENRSGVAPDKFGTKTGPYLWNPALAHADRAGGAAGSHANAALYPNVAGGGMWQNRDNLQARSNALPDFPGASFAGFINGAGAYHNDQGRDVLYVCDFDLWRYTLADIDDPSKDLYEKVGRQSAAVSGQGPGAYDPVRKLFVKIYGGTKNFVFWDLAAAGATNPSRSVTLAANTFNLNDVGNYGMDYDAARQRFLLWGGYGDVWSLTAPADPMNQSWVLTAIAPASGAAPNRDLSGGFTGILGKWKYVAEYDVFVGLYEPFAGDIWVYKPAAWQPQANLSADRTAPVVSVTSPAAGSSLSGSSLVQVSASDANPILEVKLYAGGRLIGSDASAPYQFTLDASALNSGLVVLRAEARDSSNNSAMSEGVMVKASAVDINQPNAVPSVTLGTPAAGARLSAGASLSIEASASDADGSIAVVEFFANGASLGADTSAPYTFVWTPVAGAYEVSARATDNRGASAQASVAGIVVSASVLPALNFTLSESAIPLGESTTLTWSASGVTDCEAFGAWSGDKSTAGSSAVTPAAAGEHVYNLTCTSSELTGGIGQSVTLTVHPAIETPPQDESGGAGGGCAIRRGAGFDPVWPLLLMLAFARRVQRTGSK